MIKIWWSDNRKVSLVNWSVFKSTKMAEKKDRVDAPLNHSDLNKQRKRSFKDAFEDEPFKATVKQGRRKLDIIPHREIMVNINIAGQYPKFVELEDGRVDGCGVKDS